MDSIIIAFKTAMGIPLVRVLFIAWCVLFLFVCMLSIAIARVPSRGLYKAGSDGAKKAPLSAIKESYKENPEKWLLYEEEIFYVKNPDELTGEDREAYERYMQLNPGKDLLGKWDEEILEGLFAVFWEDEKTVWCRHNQIITVLNRRRVDLNYWVSRLLDEMEKMTELDKKNKIIIIETMSGHNSREDEGGVHLICLYTDLEERMVAVMNELKNFY